jgi:hypothetical protein
VLSHRLLPAAEASAQQRTPEHVMADLLQRLPLPLRR